MANLINRRSVLVAAIAAPALAGTGYLTGTASAGVGTTAFQQRWSANPATDKLGAFVGIEDDRSNSHSGTTHIFAESDQYRFVMHKRDRDGSDRQRQEVRGIKSGSNRVDMHKNETWRYNYQMFIPATLKGTTSFTHIFQVKHTSVASPVITLSLGRSGSSERIELRMFGAGGAKVGTTDLAKLRDRWIDVEIEIKVADSGRVRLALRDGGTTLVDASRSGDTWLGGNQAHPKWGIYRSLNDPGQLQDTYLLVRNMKAYQDA